MKTATPLLIIPSLLLTLAACSPPDQAQENVLQGQIKALDKAKNVEKIGFDHKSQIDKVEQQAN